MARCRVTFIEKVNSNTAGELQAPDSFPHGFGLRTLRARREQRQTNNEIGNGTIMKEWQDVCRELVNCPVMHRRQRNRHTCPGVHICDTRAAAANIESQSMTHAHSVRLLRRLGESGDKSFLSPSRVRVDNVLFGCGVDGFICLGQHFLCFGMFPLLCEVTHSAHHGFHVCLERQAALAPDGVLLHALCSGFEDRHRSRRG